MTPLAVSHPVLTPLCNQTPSLSIGLARSDYQQAVSVSIAGAFDVNVSLPPQNLSKNVALDTRVYLWSNNPHGGGRFDNQSVSLVTAVVSVELSDSSTGSPYAVNSQVYTARTPVIISLPIDAASTDLQALRCGYWSATESAWRSSGMVVTGYSDSGAHCSSMHLTDFSAVNQVSSALLADGAALSEISDSGAFVAVFNPSNLTALAVVFAVLGCSAILWMQAVKADREVELARRRLYRMHIRRFGEVRHGLGLQTSHVEADHPARKRIIGISHQLQVRVARACELSIQPRPTGDVII